MELNKNLPGYAIVSNGNIEGFIIKSNLNLKVKIVDNTALCEIQKIEKGKIYIETGISRSEGSCNILVFKNNRFYTKINYFYNTTLSRRVK